MPKSRSELSSLNHIFTRFLNHIWREPDSVPFQYPVNFKDLGLLDYPILIKTPMDLSTIRKNTKANKYTNIKGFIEDLNLIWSNCKLYNLEGSEIYSQADKMEQFAEKLLSNFMKNKIKKKGVNFLHRTHRKILRTSNSEKNRSEKIDMMETNFEERIFKEKIKICQIIKKLSPEQLVHVIKLIQKNNIDAIEIISEDKFHILLENLSSGTTTKIFNYFEEIKITETFNSYLS